MVILQAHGVSKSFSGVSVLRGADVRLEGGRVRSIIGENGAGKSTLMRVLTGVLAPDEGSLSLDGTTLAFAGPASATAAGVVMVHQELALVPGLSIADNVLLGRPSDTPWRHRGGRAGQRFVREALAEVGLDIDPRTPVSELSVAQAYLIEIVKTLVFKAKVVIFDEPTAALPEAASELILGQIRNLRDQGCAVAFISHRLQEVRDISDDITVMRDGSVVADVDNVSQQISNEELIRLMVDRPVGIYAAVRPRPGTAVVLQVRDLTTSRISGVDLTVNQGEIVGLAGLVGAGRSETARAIAGADSITRGSVRLLGEEMAGRNVAKVRGSGLVLVPEDRKHEGIVPGLSVHENIHIGNGAHFRRYGLLARDDMQRASEQVVRRYDIRASSLRQSIETLSGGNQQKVILARAMETNPVLLILDEPTRGVDVRAKDEIHRLILALAERGTSVLLISSELEEVMALSHRIVVLAEGRVTADLVNGRDLEAATVMKLATPTLNLKGVAAG